VLTLADSVVAGDGIEVPSRQVQSGEPVRIVLDLGTVVRLGAELKGAVRLVPIGVPQEDQRIALGPPDRNGSRSQLRDPQTKEFVRVPYDAVRLGVEAEDFPRFRLELYARAAAPEPAAPEPAAPNREVQLAEGRLRCSRLAAVLPSLKKWVVKTAVPRVAGLWLTALSESVIRVTASNGHGLVQFDLAGLAPPDWRAFIPHNGLSRLDAALKAGSVLHVGGADKLVTLRAEAYRVEIEHDIDLKDRPSIEKAIADVWGEVSGSFSADARVLASAVRHVAGAGTGVWLQADDGACVVFSEDRASKLPVRGSAVEGTPGPCSLSGRYVQNMLVGAKGEVKVLVGPSVVAGSLRAARFVMADGGLRVLMPFDPSRVGPRRVGS
jgi:hypothetical protein